LLLDRGLLWSALVLVAAVGTFAAYYYIDQEFNQSEPYSGPVIDIAQYEQVVRDDPNNITNRIALADAYYSLDRYGEAIAQYEAALVINKDSALASVGLGRARLAVGDQAGATESLQAVIDLSEKEDISGTLVQSAHYYLGKIALDQGKPDVAITELKAATTIERSDADAWYLMGTAYVATGELDEAVSALEQAVLFVPDFTEAYQELATVYGQQGDQGRVLYAEGMVAYSEGDFDEAATKLEDAIGALPTFARAYAGLGLAREMQGERDAALLAYQQALHLQPEDFIAKGGLARLSGVAESSSESLPANHPATGDGGAGEGEVTP
jgi:tetratricopeptide (TPR) repeat protein